MAEISVGGEIDGWCTKCKLILAHMIEAMIDDKITRVHCKTCRSQHAFRPNAPGTRKTTARKAGTKTSAAKTTAAARKKAEKEASSLEELLTGRDPSEAQSYAIGASFAVGDLINHAKFELGIVTAKRDGNKIDVRFRDRSRTLIHGG